MKWPSLLCTVLTLSACVAVADAEIWNQFRGSRGGKLPRVEHPVEWSDTSNLAWAVEIPGSGWSSPTVVGDKIFLTYAESATGDKPKGMAGGVASMRTYRSAKPTQQRFVVACRNLKSGKPLWEQTVGEATPAVIHPSNTYATESPASDGERVFAFFATTGTLTAWDLDGKELWRRELGSYSSGNGFGTGSSLAVIDGIVVVQFDNDEKSFVAAFDTASGKQVWRDDRPTKTSWSSPLVWEHGVQKQLVTCGNDVVTAYNPADGKVIWRLSGMQSGFSASPAVDGERVYFGNSGPMSAGPLVALPVGSEGEISLDKDFKSDRIDWSRTKSGPGMASPIVAAGRLYIPGSGGILNCYDTQTGERVFRTRVPNMKTVVASLWGDDQQIFILDEAGTTHVVKTGPTFEVLATNKLDDLIWSTPTVADNTLLIRGVEKLYCIRN